MIKIYGEEITSKRFPDNTALLKYSIDETKYNFFGYLPITWLYESDEEQILLYYLVKHFNRFGLKNIKLFLPYIPNARMDRVKNHEEVFTLKYFAEFINSLNFCEVYVLDPHSNVSEALIEKIKFFNVERIIKQKVLYNEKGESKYDYLFFPDEGSMKRYANLFKLPYVYGQKVRDWKTGEIKSLDIIGTFEKDKTFIIIDDICSKGGTFFHSAMKLKELGAGDISLYVSHCENTILEGDLINSGFIEKVYTTNSIFTKQHELIEIIHTF